MGAGSKLDPTRIQISDISCTTEDSLSRAVRVQLRKVGISSGIPVIYSTEQPVEDIKLLPLPDEERGKGNIQELTPFDDFRVRILPVFGQLLPVRYLRFLLLSSVIHRSLAFDLRLERSGLCTLRTSRSANRQSVMGQEQTKALRKALAGATCSRRKNLRKDYQASFFSLLSPFEIIDNFVLQSSPHR